jgi:hypothetical protein
MGTYLVKHHQNSQDDASKEEKKARLDHGTIDDTNIIRTNSSCPHLRANCCNRHNVFT